MKPSSGSVKQKWLPRTWHRFSWPIDLLRNYKEILKNIGDREGEEIMNLLGFKEKRETEKGINCCGNHQEAFSVKKEYNTPK